MNPHSSAVSRLSLPAPAQRLAWWGVGLLPPILLLAWILFPAGLAIATAVYLVGLGIALRGMAVNYPHRDPGACNIVTTIRLALVSVLCAGFGVAAPFAAETAWTIFTLAAIALSLDGVDGWLARRERLVSAFGARFDMEVDALLGAALALLLLIEGRAGPELLVLGGARYAFVLATWIRPWLGAPLPQRFRRKLVCVIQIGALVALTLPILPEVASRPVALIAAALLLWSFAVDIRWLARR